MVQKQKQAPAKQEAPEQVEAKDVRNEELSDQVDETLSDIEEALGADDGLLDEIDDVLEENAAEFVANYQQKGGQ